MKKRDLFLILLIGLIIIFIVLGAKYHFRDRRTYELNLPLVEEVTKITLEEDDDKASITNVNQIDNILDTLKGVKRITEIESIQDYPVNADDVIIVRLYSGETLISFVFLYERKDKYYIEQPYNGIYKIYESEYEIIDNYI